MLYRLLVLALSLPLLIAPFTAGAKNSTPNTAKLCTHGKIRSAERLAFTRARKCEKENAKTAALELRQVTLKEKAAGKKNEAKILARLAKNMTKQVNRAKAACDKAAAAKEAYDAKMAMCATPTPTPSAEPTPEAPAE